MMDEFKNIEDYTLLELMALYDKSGKKEKERILSKIRDMFTDLE